MASGNSNMENLTPTPNPSQIKSEKERPPFTALGTCELTYLEYLDIYEKNLSDAERGKWARSEEVWTKFYFAVISCDTGGLQGTLM